MLGRMMMDARTDDDDDDDDDTSTLQPTTSEPPGRSGSSGTRAGVWEDSITGTLLSGMGGLDPDDPCGTVVDDSVAEDEDDDDDDGS
jgi:hypothetical protein